MLIDLRIEEIPSERLETILPLVQQLNPTLEAEILRDRLSEMRRLDYHCAGAYDGNRLIGICGFWIGVRFYCGRYIDLDNVIVDVAYRSAGVGKQIVTWIEEHGRANGCDISALDCYVTKSSAHKFYFREGYTILGYHFTKTLS